MLLGERWQSPGRDERLSIVKTPDFAARVHCLVLSLVVVLELQYQVPKVRGRSLKQERASSE